MKKLLLILLISLGIVGCSETSPQQVKFDNESYQWKKWDCFAWGYAGDFILTIGYIPELKKDGYAVGKLFLKDNESPIDTKRLAELIKRIEDSTISNNAAKKVFDFIWDKSNITVDQAIDELGLKQISDSSEIDFLIDEVLKNNQQMIEEYLSGKEKAFNALVGQIMKASKGKANPSQVNQILKQKIAK